MTSLLSILFILLMTPPTHSTPSPSPTSPLQSIWIADTLCRFFFLPPTTSSTPTFTNCTGPSYFKSNDFTTCYTHCCGGQTVIDTPSYQDVKRCRENAEEDKLTSYQIILIGSLVALVVVVVLGCLYKCCRNGGGGLDRSRVFTFGKKKGGGDNVVSVQWQNQTEINTNLTEITWSSQADPTKPLKQTSCCTICLQDKTNVQLFCEHQYHVHCIGLWLKKSSCCPLCRRDQIKGVKIYCLKCRWRYYVCGKKMVMGKGKKEVVGVCEECGEGEREGERCEGTLEMLERENTKEFVLDEEMMSKEEDGGYRQHVIIE